MYTTTNVHQTLKRVQHHTTPHLRELQTTHNVRQMLTPARCSTNCATKAAQLAVHINRPSTCVYKTAMMCMNDSYVFILSSSSVERIDSCSGGGVMDLPPCLYTGTMVTSGNTCI